METQIELRRGRKRVNVIAVVLFPLLALLGARPAGGAAPATRPADAAEKVEIADDGTVRRYHLDVQGRKTGAYEEVFKNGKPHVRGAYAAGVQAGAWTTYDEAGKVLEAVAYAKGVPEGPYTWNAPTGKAGVKATYRDGGFAGPVTILDDAGRVARQANYPRQLGDIRRTWATLYPHEIKPTAYTQEPGLAPPYKAGSITPEGLEEALKVAKLYRYLSGLPWQNVTLDPAATKKAQHAAVLLQKLGHLSHTPEKPADMEEAFFKTAYDGCHESNLHSGHKDMINAVRGFMDDSDPSNIQAVGHRLWILNPSLRRTGFGHANGFTAMHVVDGSRGVLGVGFISFPGEGYYPLQLVESHYAWSAHFAATKAIVPDAGSLTVRMTRLDDHFQPTEPVETRVVSVIPKPQEGLTVVVFKPEFASAGGKGKPMDAGKYGVEIAGLKSPRGGPLPFSYVVDLVELPDPPPPAEPAAKKPATQSVRRK